MIAKFETYLTRVGMKIANAQGRSRGIQLKPAQEKHLVELWGDGKHTGAELAAPFGVVPRTVYRAVHRAGEPKPARRA